MASHVWHSMAEEEVQPRVEQISGFSCTRGTMLECLMQRNWETGIIILSEMGVSVVGLLESSEQRF